jgi:hypothetical protein
MVNGQTFSIFTAFHPSHLQIKHFHSHDLVLTAVSESVSILNHRAARERNADTDKQQIYIFNDAFIRSS